MATLVVVEHRNKKGKKSKYAFFGLSLNIWFSYAMAMQTQFSLSRLQNNSEEIRIQLVRQMLYCPVHWAWFISWYSEWVAWQKVKVTAVFIEIWSESEIRVKIHLWTSMRRDNNEVSRHHPTTPGIRMKKKETPATRIRDYVGTVVMASVYVFMHFDSRILIERERNTD